MDSDSDSSGSDYVVESFVRPDKIRAPINDDTADILGNFDDSKRTEEWLTETDDRNGNENGYTQIPSQTASGQEESSDDDTDEEPEVGPPNHLSQEQVSNLLRGASKSSRFVLYVTNLNFETTREDLESYFGQVGDVKSVRIPPKRRGGFAFVEMTTVEGFRRAFELHNTDLQGRIIKIQVSEGGKKKSANKKNILKQKNRKLADMRNEGKCFTKSGKNYDKSIKKEKVKEMLLRKRWRKPKKPMQ